MLRQKTPLKRKRDKPRRNEGRVKHGRIRPIGSPLEDFHSERLKSLPCCVPGCRRGPVHRHHLMVIPAGMVGIGGEALVKVTRRDDRFQAVLCPGHHNGNTDSVHLLGSEEAFKKVHGIDLFLIAMQEWDISVQLFEKAKEKPL